MRLSAFAFSVAAGVIWLGHAPACETEDGIWIPNAFERKYLDTRRRLDVLAATARSCEVLRSAAESEPEVCEQLACQVNTISDDLQWLSNEAVRERIAGEIGEQSLDELIEDLGFIRRVIEDDRS
jgi:hypothetical protein